MYVYIRGENVCVREKERGCHIIETGREKEEKGGLNRKVAYCVKTSIIFSEYKEVNGTEPSLFIKTCLAWMSSSHGYKEAWEAIGKRCLGR